MKLRQASLGSEVPNVLATLPFADGAEGAEMSIPLFDMTRWPAPAGDCREWLLLVYLVATRAGRKCDTSLPLCVCVCRSACLYVDYLTTICVCVMIPTVGERLDGPDE